LRFRWRHLDRRQLIGYGCELELSSKSGGGEIGGTPVNSALLNQRVEILGRVTRRKFNQLMEPRWIRLTCRHGRVLVEHMYHGGVNASFRPAFHDR
jgi:hypothetical protein